MRITVEEALEKILEVLFSVRTCNCRRRLRRLRGGDGRD